LAEAIIGEPKGLHWIDQEKCHKCGVCFEICPPRVFSVEIRTGETEMSEGEAL
jgi:NADH-quinone oxidoreductase subunit F